MVAALESTYAEKSWLQFKTVTKKIRELELKYGLDLSLPWGLPEKMNFIMSCSDQDLKADSIKVYFSKVNFDYGYTEYFSINFALYTSTDDL